MSSFNEEAMQLANAAQLGDKKSLGRLLRLLITALSGGEPLAIGASLTITSQNARNFNGRMLVFSAAYTLTLSVGLPKDFGFTVCPPQSGDASIAFASGVTDAAGGTTTLTRTYASNTLFAVATVGANKYAVTGS